MLDYIRNPFAVERVSAMVGKIKISNKKIMNISSMLDYIRNPFASKRLSVVVGKSKFLIRKL